MEKQTAYKLGQQIAVAIEKAVLDMRAAGDEAGFTLDSLKEVNAEHGFDLAMAAAAGALDQLEESGDPAKISGVISDFIGVANSINARYLDENKEAMEDDTTFGVYMQHILQNFYMGQRAPDPETTH